jgi:hypothetical protein
MVRLRKFAHQDLIFLGFIGSDANNDGATAAPAA